MIQRIIKGVRGRLAACAAAACAVTVAGVMVAGPPASAAEAGRAQAAGPSRITPPPGGVCSDVTIIGARGSGQPYDVGGTFNGFGPEVDKAITIIEGDLRAKRVSYGAESVKYPADSVNDLDPSLADLLGDWPDYQKNHLDKFMNSIATGVNESVNYAEWAQQTCHDSKVIMVGYSQGAMVMHQAELLLKTRDRAAFNLIIGTVLVADGNRQGNTKARQFGSSPANGSGIETWVTNTLRHGQPYADVPLPGGTANICNNSDIVCDTSLGALWDFSFSAKVHTTSYADCNSKNQCSYGSALIDGATWVGKLAASKV